VSVQRWQLSPQPIFRVCQFEPDIEMLKTKGLGQGEWAPALTKLDWIKLIIASVQKNIPTASSDQALGHR
jgi:hypothetical protein